MNTLYKFGFTVILSIYGAVYAQTGVNDTIPYAYCIAVEQGFTSSGDCFSDPEYEKADIIIYNSAGVSYETISISEDYLDKLQILPYHYTTTNPDNNLASLINTDGNNLNQITISTVVSNIRNDKELEYDFTLTDLKPGLNVKAQSASDPCNNGTSFNREEYTMTTRVYIDDPINLSNSSDVYTLMVETDRLTLNLSDFYNYNGTAHPILQVSPDNGSNWYPIPDVLILSNTTLKLSYEHIAGEKGADESHYFKWLGKNLSFRVVKKLMNGTMSYGTPVAGVKFYKQGLQFIIPQVIRNCSDQFEVYVQLLDNQDEGLFTEIDEEALLWKIKSSINLFECIMETTDVPLKYKIVPKEDDLPENPFHSNNEEDEIWELQLVENGNTNMYACVKEFTVPSTPEEGILIEQIKNQYTINNHTYDAPDQNYPFVLLNIDDPYEYANLRQPYIIKEGENLLKILPSVTTTYEEMSAAEKAIVDDQFDEEFDAMVALESNVYKDHFSLLLEAWMDNNPKGFCTNLPVNNCENYVFSHKGDFIVFENFNKDTIFKVNIDTSNFGQWTYPISKIIKSNNLYIGGISNNDMVLILSQNSYLAKASLNTTITEAATQIGNIPYSFYLANTNLDEPNLFYDVDEILIDLPFIDSENPEGIYRLNINDGSGDCLSTSTYLWPSLRSNYNSFVYLDGSWHIVILNDHAIQDPELLCGGGSLKISHNGTFALYKASGGISRVRLDAPYTSTQVIPRNVLINNVAFTNDGRCLYYYQGTGTDKIDEGIYFNNFDNTVGTKLVDVTASSLTMAPNENYIIYFNEEDKKTYKLYAGLKGGIDELYPDKGMASSWYEDFKSQYKKTWLVKRFSTIVTKDIHANQSQHLILEDANKCKHEFDIYVNTPTAPIFVTGDIHLPSNACANDGNAMVTLTNQGTAPYAYRENVLTGPGSSCRVYDLVYGDNKISFLDNEGNISYEYIINITGTTGISCSVPQACAGSNGAISVSAINISGSKTYIVSCENPLIKIDSTISGNTCVFTNLPSGNYTSEILTPTGCNYSEYDIQVPGSIFNANISGIINASKIANDYGTVTFEFENRIGNVTWTNSPVQFTTTNSNSITYNNIVPGTHNYTANNSGCSVSGTFTIDRPRYNARVTLDERDTSCLVLVSLTEANALLSPFTIRLEDAMGNTIHEAEEGSAFATTITNETTYIIYLQYNTNEVELYRFDYPIGAIDTSRMVLDSLVCLGDIGHLDVNASIGIDNIGFTYSTDGLSYNVDDVLPLTSGNLTWFIRDENNSFRTDGYGDTVVINQRLTKRYNLSIPEPEPVNARTVRFMDVTCAGLDNGNVLLKQTAGGSGQYQFRADSGAWYSTLDTIKTLIPGDHLIYLKDALYQCDTVSLGHIAITQPDSLLFDSIDVRQSTCRSNNAYISVDMTGGTVPYAYNWHNFSGDFVSDSSRIDSLSQSDYYFLDVTDLNGCTQHFEQAINPSNGPHITKEDIVINSVDCYGDSTGSAKVLHVTPSKPYSPWWLTWSDGSVGDSASGFPAGWHKVTVTDSSNCKSVFTFQVPSETRLRSNLSGFRDAQCFGYSNGYLRIAPQGGAGGYRYQWSNGDTTNLADSLSIGTYDVTLTDHYNCFRSFTYPVSQPELLQINLGDDISMCPGNTVTIDGQDYASHLWATIDGSVFSDHRFVDLTQENGYIVQITNDSGCIARDTIALTIGNDALQADFLMSSQAYFGDTLTIYELSNMPLDSMKWEYNTDIFSDITSEDAFDYVLELESSDTGIYNVKLTAFSGGCISQAIKQVQIIYDTDSTDDNFGLGYQDPLITSMIVYPNPNDGIFTMEINLREEADIEVSIFYVSLGVKINDRFEQGQKDYLLDYSLNDLSPGVYVIMLYAGDERRQAKMMIMD